MTDEKQVQQCAAGTHGDAMSTSLAIDLLAARAHIVTLEASRESAVRATIDAAMEKVRGERLTMPVGELGSMYNGAVEDCLIALLELKQPAVVARLCEVGE